VLAVFRNINPQLLSHGAAAGVEASCCVVGRGNGTYARQRFFHAKMAQENRIKASSIPYTIIRATQFFEFVNGLVDFATRATKCACLLRSSSHGGRRCGSAVARVATGAPVNGMVEVGGPESFASMNSPGKPWPQQGSARGNRRPRRRATTASTLARPTLLPGEGGAAQRDAFRNHGSNSSAGSNARLAGKAQPSGWEFVGGRARPALFPCTM